MPVGHRVVLAVGVEPVGPDRRGVQAERDGGVVGLDVVEIAPPLDPSEATVFAGLKIIMEYIAVIAREKQK